MDYKIIAGRSISEYKNIFIETYCNKDNPVYTFDNIKVNFQRDMFEHAFYESFKWERKDKSIFSIKRAEKIMWIKDTLQDPYADLRIGWNKKTKSYNKSRRVAIVKNNYVVIIQIINKAEARFITAYEADNSISKILDSPIWEGLK